MKRIIMYAAAFALAAGTAFASGVADGRYGVWTHARAKGPIVEKEIYITPFDTVDVSGVGTVRWKAGATPKLIVRTSESLFEHLDCGTEGGRLKLGFRPGVSVSGLQVLEFELVSPAFRALNLSGASDFQAESQWETREIAIDISGSGSVTADLEARRAAVRLSGSGSIQLSGEVDDFGLDLSGSASVAARGLEARNVKPTLSGAGKVEATATETLIVDASGSGSVRYWGTPVVTARTSGSADVRSGK